jgi:hypothetical protein
MTYELLILFSSFSGNGLGFKYNYAIQHGYHGHASGSSYPNGYGGFGAPAAGYDGGYGRGFRGGLY